MKKITWIALIFLLAFIAYEGGKEIGCRMIEKEKNMCIDCHSTMFKGR